MPSTTRALTFSRARTSSASVAGSSRKRCELVGDDLHRLDEVVRARADVEADLARVGVLAGERVDRVGEPALLAHGLEQPRRGQPAEDRVQHAGGEAAVVAALQPEAAEASRGPARCPCARSARSATGVAGAGSGVGAGSSSSRIALRALGEFDDRVVVDRAGGGDHDRAGHVAARVEVGDHVDRRVADHRRAADDRAPERVRCRRRPRRARRRPCPAGRPRTSRSPRARPRARGRRP